MVEVPYKGTGPAVLDALGNQIPVAVGDLPAALQQVKAGKLIAYAVTSPQRLPMLPDVPTVSEAGLTGYDSTGWFGVVAPAGTSSNDHREAQRRDHRGAERRAGQGEHAQPGRGADAEHTGRLRLIYPRRDA